MSFQDYASVLNEVIVYSAELVFFQPISINNTNTCTDRSEYTPWIRAGITDFSICHVFDVEIFTPCPSYEETTSGDDIYIASGSFEIAAIQSVELYKQEMIDILGSNKFIDTFTEQMNIRLSNYTSRRRLETWTGFSAIDVAVIDPNTDTSNPTITPEPTPKPTIIVSPSNTEDLATDTSAPTTSEPSTAANAEISAAATGSDNNSESPLVVGLLVTIVLLIVLLIICGIFSYYQTKKFMTDSYQTKGDNLTAQALEMHLKETQLRMETLEPQKGKEVPDLNNVMQIQMQPVSQIKQPGLAEGHAVTKGGYDNDDISLEDDNVDPFLVASINALDENLPSPNGDAKE